MIIEEKIEKCPVCGGQIETFDIVSRSSYPDQDLDLRNGGETTPIFTCPYCYFTANKIPGTVSEDVKEFVKSNEYRSAFKEKNVSKHVEAMYLAKLKLDLMMNKSIEEIALDYQNLAWLCDDGITKSSSPAMRRELLTKSYEYRKKAIECYEKSQLLTSEIILVDLYRRTSHFKKALNQLEKLSFHKEFESIYKLQKTLIEKKDIKAHRIPGSNKLEEL